MFVLLGEFSVSGNGLESYLRRHGWGRMWGRDAVKFEYPHEFMGFDNGAWESYSQGKKWREDKFLRRLDYSLSKTQPHHRRVVVAALPDIVAGGMRSFELSMSWISRLPSVYPWFLPVQDGMEVDVVRSALSQVAGLFLGGSDRFKTTAKMWCDMAHQAGKMFHWARCRSINNVREAWAIGADSIDSTRPIRAWVSGERHRAKGWLNAAMGHDPQLALF